MVLLSRRFKQSLLCICVILNIYIHLKVNTMNTKNLTLLTLSVIVISSCATRASGVAPMSVSSSEYTSLTCEETTTLLSQKRSDLTTLSEAQDKAARQDSWGVFLFAVPISKITGAAVEGDLAQVKGEVIAIERALPMNCKNKE